MKRFILATIFLVLASAANAQYSPSAELLKKGGKLYQGDLKLSNEQINRILSAFHDENGIAYNELWNKAGKMRRNGVILTSVGSGAFVLGATGTLFGIVYVLATGIGSSLSGNPDGLKGEAMLYSGMALGGAGIVMLGTGIPLLCVGGNRMKDVVNGYNSQRLMQPSEPAFTLAFGPCPNGIGLSLSF